MNITELKKMTVEEKIQLMEQLWDSLCQEEAHVESPTWHQRILEDRKKELNPERPDFLL